MGSGASSKAVDQTAPEGSLGTAAGNQPVQNSKNMNRKASIPVNSTINAQTGGGPAEKNTLEQKIQSFLTLPEDDFKEALSLAAKYPDLQDAFTHTVNIMYEVDRKDPMVFVQQLMKMFKFVLSATPAIGKDMMDFFALLGGAEATAEIYTAQLQSMGISHVTDELVTSGMAEEKHEATVKVINILRMFWEHGTDCSLEFGGRLAETDLLSCLAEDLKNFGHNFSSGSPVFNRSLTILHNCARNRQKKQRFRDIDAISLLTPFLAREEKDMKLLTLLTLSYIIDEEDNDLLFADASDFDFLLAAVAFAWKEEDHRDTNGYSLEELLQGLGNLAQNDDNKKMLMEKDVLELLEPILETGSDAEKEEAAEIIWQLAFDKGNRSKMEKDQGLIDLLEKQMKSSHNGVAKACSGALWVLNKDNKLQQGNGGTPPSSGKSVSALPPPLSPLRGHVMISYQWANQKDLLQIKNSLQSQGFRVWMDVDNMSGSTLQAMAEAVEQADAVLICMSQRYKDSNNCRSEAEYAYEKQKPIIPLLMEKNYKPDGWLGILRGSKLYFDFTGKYPYEKKLEELVKELRQRGFGDSSEIDGPIAAEKARPVGSSPAVNVNTWSQKDVLNWLNEHDLRGCRKLKNLSGEKLKFLQELSHTAPEFFFIYLEKKLALTSMDDLMHFSNAIRKLP